MQKLTPFLWFKDQAEEAVDLYTAIFRNSKKGKVLRYGAEGPGPEGSVLTVEFELEGMEFVALNGGPAHEFNPAVSFVINCNTQEEIDYYWEKLLADGGREDMCGWLQDKFGLSWQVVPPVLTEMLADKDRAKAGRVMQAMLKMRKLDIPTLKAAYEG